MQMRPAQGAGGHGWRRLIVKWFVIFFKPTTQFNFNKTQFYKKKCDDDRGYVLTHKLLTPLANPQTGQERSYNHQLRGRAHSWSTEGQADVVNTVFFYISVIPMLRKWEITSLRCFIWFNNTSVSLLLTFSFLCHGTPQIWAIFDTSIRSCCHHDIQDNQLRLQGVTAPCQ